MRDPRRLWAVVLLAVVSLLALIASGLLDWITSLLFLGLEFLVESLRPLWERPKKHRHRTQPRGRRLAES
ncbi:hypothetical protein ACYOEI_39445, partial [Singulisphaera rosea]